MIKSGYNLLAGQSLERLNAISDGIFAVAMTLLVLDLHSPASELIHSEGQLQSALIKLAPRLLPYFMSFLTLGIFWHGQQAQIQYFAKGNRHLTWIHLGFLLFVTLLPFSTNLLAEFMTFRIALLVYWFNIFMMGMVLLGSWKYAERAKLLTPEADSGVSQALMNRIFVAQILYAASAAGCLISTYLSVGLIIAIQLDYAIAPRFRSRTKPSESAD